MNLLKNRKERFLLFYALTAFILLCVIEIKLPLISILNETLLGKLLVADGARNIASGLLISIIAAYIFYIFIDFLPRTRREQRTMLVLNSLIASILDAYNRCRLFGHETALPYVDKSVLEKEWLNRHIALLKENSSNYLPLMFAMQTAHSRLEDFRHSLPLAVLLSPEHAMQWLVIIDKVRLLAENFGQGPEVPEEKIHLINKNTDENPAKDYKSTLNLRILEIAEEADKWLFPHSKG